MPDRRDTDEEFEDWTAADDPDGPQECDLAAEDDEETPTVPCPSCRTPIPEFTDHCPYCGDWITPTSGEFARHHSWFAMFVVLIVAALLFLWLR